MSRHVPLAFAVLLILSPFAAWAPQAAAEENPYEVKGRVVSDKGEPVEGALVYGSTYNPESGTGSDDRAVTDAEGAFVLRLAAGQGKIGVEHHEWRANEGREITVDGNVDDVTFTLRAPPPKTATVEGRVLDAQGNPIEGAHVRIETGCCAYAEPARDAPEPLPATPQPSPTPASEPEPPTEANDSGASSGGSSGATSSSMIRPAYPCCYYYGGMETVTTGPDGAFSFKTYPGPQHLSAQKSGYAVTGTQVDARDGQVVTKDVVLEKVPARDAILRGRVVDAQTGLPVAGAQVNLGNVEWSRYEHAVTGADGRFEIRTLPGWSQLTVYANGYHGGEPMPLVETDPASSKMIAPAPASGGYYQHQTSFRLASGDNTRDVQMEPKPKPTVVLQGYVVDPETQKGVAGATVNVWNQDTGDWGSAVTDAAGSYKMLVRPGHYTANTWADGHLPGATSFIIREDEKLKRVDVESPAGQSRYAPCDDCDHRTYTAQEAEVRTVPAATAVASMEKGAGYDAASAPPPAPALAGGASRGAAYEGSGGGLPPYNPAEAPRPQSQDAAVEGAKNTVPAAGALLAAAAVGLAALFVARRRS